MSHMWYSENMELILEKKKHINIIQRMKLSKNICILVLILLAYVYGQKVRWNTDNL